MYAVLALLSIAFGYGFWWKVIASRSKTLSGIEISAASLQKQVDAAENAVRLVGELLSAVAKTADMKQRQEVSTGGTCGIVSTPGDGRLSKLRSDVTSQIGALKGNVETLWLDPLREVLDGKRDSSGRSVGGLRDAQAKLDIKLMRELPEDERRRVYDEVRKVSAEAIGTIGALNNTRGKLFAERFTTLAASLEVPPTRAFSTCNDPDLAQQLRYAASVARSSPVLLAPEFEVNEGANATAKAFNKIWDNILWIARQSPSSLGLISAEAQPAPLKGRDFIALIASAVVGLCILVLAFVRTRHPLDAFHVFPSAQARVRSPVSAELQKKVARMVERMIGRDIVFISYSHHDELWRERLETMLKPLVRA